jgi:hypothetical protein
MGAELAVAKDAPGRLQLVRGGADPRVQPGPSWWGRSRRTGGRRVIGIKRGRPGPRTGTSDGAKSNDSSRTYCRSNATLKRTEGMEVQRGDRHGIATFGASLRPERRVPGKGSGGSRRFLQGGIGKIRVNGVYYGPVGSSRIRSVINLAEVRRYGMAPRFGECGGGPFSESDADA